MLAKTKPNKVHVLIVDDSRLIRAAASKMLNPDEFTLQLATDGAEAWSMIQRDSSIQVVFTDLVMPEMDGFELLEAVRTSPDEAIQGLPVIIATGADNPEIAKQKALSLGATDFVSKPFDAMALRTRALSYANLHKTTQQLKEQSTIDVLTGLVNHKGFAFELDKQLSFARRHQSHMAVMAIEIDGFKDVFIRVGRSGAENIVKKIAGALTESTRLEDTVARTGLATFAVSLPLAADSYALELADRICRKVEAFRARLDGKKMHITVSAGVCAVDTDLLVEKDTVFALAERALEKASTLGRSQIAQLSLKENYQADSTFIDDLSIDEMLGQIHQGEHLPASYMEQALQRLQPLLSMLTQQQRQRLLH